MRLHVTQALSRLLPRRRTEEPDRVAPGGDYFARVRQANPDYYAELAAADPDPDEVTEEALREREEALRAFYLGTEDEQDPR